MKKIKYNELEYWEKDLVDAFIEVYKKEANLSSHIFDEDANGVTDSCFDTKEEEQLYIDLNLIQRDYLEKLKEILKYCNIDIYNVDKFCESR